jgi:hypothetical protein
MQPIFFLTEIHAAKVLLGEEVQEIKTQSGVTINQIIKGYFIYMQFDNSWETPQHAGQGVLILSREDLDGVNHAIYTAAKTTVNSVLQAEAKAMDLGSSVLEALHLTNNFILAKPADIRDPNKNPDQWIIMPFLNYYFQNTQNQQSRVFKIGRSYNKVAHRQAQDL